MPVCNTTTAENLLCGFSTTMEKEQLSWENVVGFASDMANVMVGARNSVLSRLEEKKPNIFSFGCLCHLANLCSAAALKNLPFSIDNCSLIYFIILNTAARGGKISLRSSLSLRI